MVFATHLTIAAATRATDSFRTIFLSTMITRWTRLLPADPFARNLARTVIALLRIFARATRVTYPPSTGTSVSHTASYLASTVSVPSRTNANACQAIGHRTTIPASANRSASTLA